jgi:hypothetical protein
MHRMKTGAVNSTNAIVAATASTFGARCLVMIW